MAELVDAEAITEIIPVTPRTIRNWAKDGYIPAEKYGRKWFFDPIKIRAWKRKREQKKWQSINAEKPTGLDSILEAGKYGSRLEQLLGL